MKKLFCSVLCILSVVVACAFAGCSNNVSGATFKFMGTEYDGTKFTKEEDRKMFDEVLDRYSKYTVGVEIVFFEDGTVKRGEEQGTYVQDGRVVKMTFDGVEDEGLIGFKKLSITKTVSGFSFGSCDFRFDYERI